jgi:hypothetical protein
MALYKALKLDKLRGTSVRLHHPPLAYLIATLDPPFTMVHGFRTHIPAFELVILD